MTLLPFDLLFIGEQSILMDYPCANLAILVSAVLVLDRQTDRITAADNAMLTRLPSA